MDASKIDKETGIKYYWGCIIKHKGGGFSNTTYKVCKIADVRELIKSLSTKKPSNSSSKKDCFNCREYPECEDYKIRNYKICDDFRDDNSSPS